MIILQIIKPDQTKLDILEVSDLNQVDESDDEQVYCLSRKYDKKEARFIMILRYILLIIIIFLSIPNDLYTGLESRNAPVRIGYFADVSQEKSVNLNNTSEFLFEVTNCNIYLLENKDSSSKIDLFMSSNRDASLSISVTGSTQTIIANSDTSLPKCFLEVKIPGGVSISQMSFKLDGGSSDNMLVYDHKDGSSWNTPMIINTLQFTISDSYPVIKFENAHQVTSLSVTGTYCACTFDKVRINSMTYDINVGTLSINQNSVFAENKVTITTPDGLFCVAGSTVNSNNNG